MIRLNSGIVWVLIGLFAFGVAYNALVAWLERHGYDEGYTAILVVVGVLITIAAIALIDPRAAGLILAAFAASGAPMALGSFWRHVKARERGAKAILDEITQ